MKLSFMVSIRPPRRLFSSWPPSDFSTSWAITAPRPTSLKCPRCSPWRDWGPGCRTRPRRSPRAPARWPTARARRRGNARASWRERWGGASGAARWVDRSWRRRTVWRPGWGRRRRRWEPAWWTSGRNCRGWTRNRPWLNTCLWWRSGRDTDPRCSTSRWGRNRNNVGSLLWICYVHNLYIHNNL